MADVTDELNDLKQRLEVQKKAEGQDLYKHVVKTLSHLVKHCPHDTLNKFEEVSYLLKHSDRLDHRDYLKSDVVKNYAKPADQSTIESTTPIIQGTKGMFPPVSTSHDPFFTVNFYRKQLSSQFQVKTGKSHHLQKNLPLPLETCRTCSLMPRSGSGAALALESTK